MLVASRQVFALEPIARDPEVGRWLSAMEWARRETLGLLEKVSDDMVDFRPSGGENTIGTLLYHLALVEAEWLVEQIFEGTLAWPHADLQLGDHDPEGALRPVEGVTLSQHIARLDAVRSMFFASLRPMTAEEFHRVRPRDDFDVAPDWVVKHLVQHEAKHRAQIAALREAHPAR
jgi:uncharacterized damage-inducible protein DinB